MPFFRVLVFLQFNKNQSHTVDISILHYCYFGKIKKNLIKAFKNNS